MHDQPEPPEGQSYYLSTDVLANLAAADPRRRRRVVLSVTEFQQGLDRLAERGIVQRVRHSDGTTMYGCAGRRRTRAGRSGRVATNTRAKGSKRSSAAKSARQSSSDDPGGSESDDDGGDGERPKVCRSPRCDTRHHRRSPYCSGRCKKWHSRHPHGVLEPIKADAPLDSQLADLDIDQLHARIEAKLSERAWGWRQYPPIPSGAAIYATSEPTGVEAELRDLWRYVRLRKAAAGADDLTGGGAKVSGAPADISIAAGTEAPAHGHWPVRRPRRSSRPAPDRDPWAGAMSGKLPPRAATFSAEPHRRQTAYDHLQEIEAERAATEQRAEVVELRIEPGVDVDALTVAVAA